MGDYRFYYPIQVRYGDCDPQGHVNNSRNLTFIESARIAYIQNLDLWDGHDFMELGLIVANTKIDFKAPIFLGQEVRVGVRVTRLGNKSLDFEYLIEDAKTRLVLSTANTAMVAYDYHKLAAVVLNADWRRKIAAFEGIPERA